MKHLAAANKAAYRTEPSSYLFIRNQTDAWVQAHVILIGALAQLGERLICIQEVIGSIPIGSTISCVCLPDECQPLQTAHGSVAQVVRAHA